MALQALQRTGNDLPNLEASGARMHREGRASRKQDNCEHVSKHIVSKSMFMGLYR